ncbi:50S ribosomal protein L18a [Candidatus Micrarchaeota archaeon]|nr:50S ribosomal protein L18a [Candidatus Micrarchaeota archaeon]MBU1165728.1 50S ribosomal protein L18a [Candidatus Micrarchaeota archaeon]MBU1887095.1 50S ribosomal protein L18a [Candidatus Micrarchaeota archaeon]
MKFIVSGKITLGKGKRNFSKEVEAKTENHAKDLVYALMGSNNGTARNKIKIETIVKG